MYSLKSYKKVMCAAAALCITFGAATAQPSGADEGFYVQLGGGYSFGAGKGYPERNSSRTYTSSSGDESGTTSNASFSLGKGVNTVLGFGYMLNKNVGVELNAGYLIGGSNAVEYSSESVYSGYTTFDTGTETYTLSSLELTPALRLVAPIGDSYSLYSRVGVIVPIFGTAVYEYDEDERREGSNPSTSSEHRRQEFTSYFKLGCAAALGVSANFGERVSVFAEVNAAVRSFELKKGTITELTKDGISQLENLDAKDKETEYLKELKYSSYDDRKGKEVSTSMPASSVGVTVGVIFKF